MPASTPNGSAGWLCTQVPVPYAPWWRVEPPLSHLMYEQTSTRGHLYYMTTSECCVIKAIWMRGRRTSIQFVLDPQFEEGDRALAALFCQHVIAHRGRAQAHFEPLVRNQKCALLVRQCQQWLNELSQGTSEDLEDEAAYMAIADPANEQHDELQEEDAPPSPMVTDGDDVEPPALIAMAAPPENAEEDQGQTIAEVAAEVQQQNAHFAAPPGLHLSASETAWLNALHIPQQTQLQSPHGPRPDTPEGYASDDEEAHLDAALAESFREAYGTMPPMPGSPMTGNDDQDAPAASAAPIDVDLDTELEPPPWLVGGYCVLCQSEPAKVGAVHQDKVCLCLCHGCFEEHGPPRACLFCRSATATPVLFWVPVYPEPIS